MTTITIVDLPRSHWRLLPPRRSVVLITVVVIVVSALAFGLFG